MIINAILAQLKLAIGAGIGFFIAFIGLKKCRYYCRKLNQHFVGLGNLQEPTVILAVVGILITLLLLTKNVPGAVFYGLVGTAVVGIFCWSLWC